MQHELSVSIVVPIFNVELYLRECVDTIIAQTYKELEIILVDDGSTDSCGKICDEYASLDRRIAVIHKTNGGLSDARNAGAAAAHGDLLYFCDSDDYLAPDTIEILVKTISEHDAEAVFFDAVAFEDGRQTAAHSYTRKQRYDAGNGAELVLRQFIFDEFKPCAYLFFFTGDFYRYHALHFQKGILHEDELFSYYVYKHAKKIVHLEKTLYYRRIRSGSIMTSKSNRDKKFQSKLYIFNTIRQDEVSEDYRLVQNEYLSRIGKSLLYDYRHLSGEEQAENRAIFKQAVNTIRLHKGFGDCSLYLRTYCWWPGVFISGIRKKLRMWTFRG